VSIGGPEQLACQFSGRRLRAVKPWFFGLRRWLTIRDQPPAPGLAMDIVFLRQLRIDTVIGIYEWERRTRQTLVLDLEMSADIARAAATDQISDTLDYKAVAKRLIQFVGESRFQLVETLAERCAAIIREEFGVRWVRLTLNKAGAVRGASDVGVIIERGERH
jgi:dihydroneopterin aldolase